MGTSDPTRFPEFDAIADITTLHGFKSSAGVAEVLSNAHAGILTSEFEGMPFSVWKVSVPDGRSCAIELPQLASVIKPGVSGELVPRSASEDDMAVRLADAFVATAQKIRSGADHAGRRCREIAEFTPQRQLAKVYERHRRLQQKRFGLRPERGLGRTDRGVAQRAGDSFPRWLFLKRVVVDQWPGVFAETKLRNGDGVFHPACAVG